MLLLQPRLTTGIYLEGLQQEMLTVYLTLIEMLTHISTSPYNVATVCLAALVLINADWIDQS
jgi:hypothetical protein